MKFLFLSDTHFRAERSKYRLDDDCIPSQMAEIEEVLQLAKDNDAMILHGGDLMDRPNASLSLVVKLLEKLNKFEVPFYAVVGNHDITGFNHASVKNTGLGVLFESGKVQKLEQLVFESEKVVIRGINAYINPREGDYWFDEKWNDYFKIIVSHNFVIPQSVIFDAVHPREVKTNSNIILLGHYHKAFTHTEGITQFINVGSMSRWSISEKDQKPSVLLLDTEIGKSQVINLKTSRPGNEIFDIATVEEENKRELELSNFVKSLEDTNFENVDVENVIVQQGRTQNVDKDIVELALARVQAAKVELK